MMRVEKLLRLDHQVLVILQFFRRDLQVAQACRQKRSRYTLLSGPEDRSTRLKLTPAYSGESTSVFSVVSLNCDQVSVLRFHLQRAGEFPALRQPHRGREVDAAREVSCRIEQHAIPGDDRQNWTRCGPLLASAEPGTGNSLPALVTPCGNIDVKGVHVNPVAHPVHAFAIRGDHQPRQASNRRSRASASREATRDRAG